MTEHVFPDEWTDDMRSRMHRLEMEPHTIFPPKYTMQRELRDRFLNGEFADDAQRASEAEMDPE